MEPEQGCTGDSYKGIWSTVKKKDTDTTSRSNLHALVTLPDDPNLPSVGQTGLHRYLQEISQHALLTREETDRLARKFHEEDDPDAAYRLVTANLRLVVKVSMDFKNIGCRIFLI